MPQYSAQILICFIAYIFLFYSCVGLVGNFAVLSPRTVPSVIVHCNQNEVGHQTIKARLLPGFRDPESVLIQGEGDTVWKPILNMYHKRGRSKMAVIL